MALLRKGPAGNVILFSTRHQGLSRKLGAVPGEIPAALSSTSKKTTAGCGYFGAVLGQSCLMEVFPV